MLWLPLRVRRRSGGGGAEIDDELPLDTEAATLQTINPDRDKIIIIIIIIIKGLP